MTSRNILYMGEPERVIDALTDRDANPEELRLAVLNAMQRIAGIYRELAELRAEMKRPEDSR